MRIIVKNVLDKTYHFIELVEHYHSPLHWIYNIITAKLPGIKPNIALQMFFKVFNHLVRPNILDPTLLVFSAYLYMTEINIFLSIINQYNLAMYKVVEKVKRSHTFQQVNDILNTQNSPSTNLIYDLSLTNWS